MGINEIYLKSRKAGLMHVLGHLKEGFAVEMSLANLKKGFGDPFGCLMNLSSHAGAMTISSFFRDHDLAACKQWAYVAAKIRRMMYQKEPVGHFHGYEHLAPLLSDHEQLIQWFTNFELPFTEKGFFSSPARAVTPSTPDFTSYQVLLALRGNWAELERRSEMFLHDVPRARKSYEADQRFHLALARGDRLAMESAIAQMLEPALMKRRQNKDETGYTQWFISTYAVIYSKIAWRHGYQVEVDSPWVPKEWLPVAPLSCYEDPYPFLRDFDINTPIRI